MKIVDVPAMKKITGNKVVYNVFLDTQTLDVLDALGQLTEEKFRKVIRAEMTALAEGGCYIPAMILVRPEWVPWITAEYEKCKAALQVQRNLLSH
jgi:hypothetical protein